MSSSTEDGIRERFKQLQDILSPATRTRVTELRAGPPQVARARAEELANKIVAVPTEDEFDYFELFLELGVLCWQLPEERKRKWGLSSEGFAKFLHGTLNHLRAYRTDLRSVLEEASGAGTSRARVVYGTDGQPLDRKTMVRTVGFRCSRLLENLLSAMHAGHDEEAGLSYLASQKELVEALTDCVVDALDRRPPMKRLREADWMFAADVDRAAELSFTVLSWVPSANGERQLMLAACGTTSATIIAALSAPHCDERVWGPACIALVNGFGRGLRLKCGGVLATNLAKLGLGKALGRRLQLVSARSPEEEDVPIVLCKAITTTLQAAEACRGPDSTVEASDLHLPPADFAPQSFALIRPLLTSPALQEHTVPFLCACLSSADRAVLQAAIETISVLVVKSSALYCHLLSVAGPLDGVLPGPAVSAAQPADVAAAILCTRASARGPSFVALVQDALGRLGPGGAGRHGDVMSMRIELLRGLYPEVAQALEQGAGHAQAAAPRGTAQSSHAPQITTCSAPGCNGNDMGANRLMRCRGCSAVSYCGRECQKRHWKAGHKQECPTLANEKRRARTSSGTGE